MNKFKKYWIYFTCIIIFVCFISLSVFSATRESLTYDEIVYFQTGIEALKNQKFDIDTNNPPLIKEIGALPAFLIDRNTDPYKISPEKIFYSRLIIIFLSSILLFSVFLACKSYFGLKSALFAVFLLILEPNIIGNNHYFTLDMGVTLFFFLTYIFFLEALKKSSIKNYFLFSLFLGLSMSSKTTVIPFFGICLLTILILKFRRNIFSWIWQKKHYLIASFLLTLFVIWSAYFFKVDVLVAKREDQNRVSSKLLLLAKKNNNKLLESAIYFSQNQKIPLGNYLATVKNMVIRGSKESGGFFMGNYYESNNWYFMPVNFLLKMPLPLLIFFLISVFGITKLKNRTEYSYFIVPVFAILFIASISNMQPLVRYILPLYPLLIVTASISIKFFNTIYLKFIFVILCAWYLYGTFSYFPHSISFANELTGERSKRYEKFIDSNIDWGQSLPDFRRYIETKKPKLILFSYFGRDNGDLYNLNSDFKYGSYKFKDICRFHNISKAGWKGNTITAISISNWYYCGYYKNIEYSKEKIVDVAGDSILIFK